MAIETTKWKSKTTYRAVFCKNRQRITKCFDRKIDAQQWLEKQENIHRFGIKKKLSFHEASQIWLENHSKIRKSPSAHMGDQRIIRIFRDFCGEISLEEISPVMIERYIASSLPTGRKATTINRELQVIRTIFNYFIRKQYIAFNPVVAVGLLPEAEVISDYLSFEEADRLLTYANNKYETKDRWVYRFYLLALNTGLRWGEIAALQWDRVDFTHHRITVSRNYCHLTKQIRETTKSRKIRYVGINSSLLPELRTQFMEKAKHPENLVFSKNAKVIDLSNFKRDHFHKDLAEVGIRQIRFHDFRHTFASHFMMRGGSLYDLQKLMGHSNITVTERYAHLSPESLVAKTELVAIDGMNKIVRLENRNSKLA